MTSATLAAALERQRVAGWIDTPFHDVHRKVRMLVGGDRSVAFGMSELLPTTAEEVTGAISRLAAWDMQNGSRGRSYVSPEAVAAQAAHAAERLRLACERGERVFFGTGHPTGPLELYARVARAMQERGAEVVRVAEGDSFEGYIGGSRILYVCDVACVSLAGDLMHTHSARPMEFLLASGMRVDLVVGDHGFVGAGLMRGMDAVAIVDTNDPALVLAWSRGLPVRPILCDDNRPPGAYAELTRFLIDSL